MAPFVGREEHEQLVADSVQLDLLRIELREKEAWSATQDRTIVSQGERILELDGIINEQNLALDALRISARVVAAADETRALLEERLSELQIGEGGRLETMLGVEEVLTENARQQVTKEFTEGLIETHREEYLEHVRVTEGPAIMKEQDEVLETSGRYKTVREQALVEFKRGISADLIAEEEKKVRAELYKPTSRDAFITEIAPTIANDPRIAQFREALEDELHPLWREMGVQLAIAQEEREVRAREPEIIQQTAEEFARTNRGKRELKEVREKVEESIKAMTIEDLLRATGDATHLELLAERAQIEADTLAKKNISDKLKGEFFNGGIDTDAIKEGTTLEIQLGEISTKNEDTYDYNSGRYRSVKHSTLLLARSLTLTALGDGLYRVDLDTLRDSKNVYANKAALPEGAVIAVGMLISTPGKDGRNKPTLKRALKPGATLQYDTDTTTEDFTDTSLPIADVIVNGTSVREIKNVDKKLV